MSDEDTPQDPAEESTEQEQVKPQEGDLSEIDKDEALAWSPDEAKRKISKINNEIRTAKRQAQEAATKAQPVEDLQRANGDLTAANMRLEVGYELGLPLSLAKRLTGATKEEMIADAEALVELISPAKRPPSQRPAEHLRGGGDPDREPEETDLKKIGARMFDH